MDIGLSIAASGMLAEQVREDQLANDLANASTPGYKVERTTQQAFGAMLLSGASATATGASALSTGATLIGTPQQVGPIATTTEITGETADLSQAGIKTTGNPLDFAVSGSGFFAVRTSAGVRYTRDGEFSATAAGGLVDASGNPVLDQAGQPVKLGADGTVAASALGVFALTGAAEQGDNLFTGTAQGRASGVVQAGALEGSGVDPARTIVDMIAALNDYQSGEKVIQTIDQVEQRSATTVGALGGG